MKHIEIYIKYRKAVLQFERKLIKMIAKKAKKMPKIAKMVLNLYILYVDGVINMDSMINKRYLHYRKKCAEKQKRYIKQCMQCKNCTFHLVRALEKYLCYRRRYIHRECKFSKAYLRYRRIVFFGEMRLLRLFTGCHKKCCKKKKKMIAYVILGFIFYRTRVFCLENKIVKMNWIYQKSYYNIEKIRIKAHLFYCKWYSYFREKISPGSTTGCDPKAHQFIRPPSPTPSRSSCDSKQKMNWISSSICSLVKGKA